MKRCVKAVFAAAEDPTVQPILEALAVFFDAVGFSALAPFFNFLDFDSEAEPLLPFHLPRPFFGLLKAARVPSKRFVNGLLVLSYIISVIATVVAIAILGAEDPILEALAVKFEALGSLAVAACFFGLFTFLVLVDVLQNIEILVTFGIAAF